MEQWQSVPMKLVKCEEETVLLYIQENTTKSIIWEVVQPLKTLTSLLSLFPFIAKVPNRGAPQLKLNASLSMQGGSCLPDPCLSKLPRMLGLILFSHLSSHRTLRRLLSTSSLAEQPKKVNTFPSLVRKRLRKANGMNLCEDFCKLEQPNENY